MNKLCNLDIFWIENEAYEGFKCKGLKQLFQMGFCSSLCMRKCHALLLHWHLI